MAILSVTIAAGQSLSAIAGLDRQYLVGIAMPAQWTAAEITLQADPGDGVLRDVYGPLGTELSIPVGANRYILLEPALTAGLSSLRLRSGTSAAAVNQAAQRALLLVIRDID